MMIKELTQEQVRKFPEYVEKWLNIGLSTEPLDKEAASKAIDEVYICAGKKPPQIKIFLDSPFSGSIGSAILKGVDVAGAQVGAQVRAQVGAQVWDQVGAQVWDQVRAQVRAQVGAQVWDQVGAQVGAQVWDQVGAQVWDQVGAQVWDQVGAQVWDQVRAQVRDQVWDQVGAQVGAQVWDQVGAQVYNAGYGSHDANWLALYEFFLNETQLKCCEKLSGLMTAAGTLGWFWPFENAVIITPRPIKIKFDDEKRLHCEDGPAILYPDGWGVYAWHGVRIPKEWIEDKVSLTPEIALHWENTEQRGAACAILGWHNVLEHPSLNPKIIDEDDDPQIGKLVSVELPDIGRESFLLVECGTKRKFALPVPPEMKTALDAQAWINFCTPEDILNIETRT